MDVRAKLAEINLTLPGHGSRVEVWRPISPFGVSAGRAGAGGSIREAVLTIEAWVSYLSPLLF